MPKVFIYADESCLGNSREKGTPGGAGGVIELWRNDEWQRRDFWLSERNTTNNRMAIYSGIVGLESLRVPCDVVFTSDSQYLVRGMSEWIYGWMRRNWMRKEGPVENADLWKELVKAATRHRVDWKWVRGHAGHPQNEYANFLATRAAREQSESNGLVDSGFVQWLEKEREKGHYLEFYEFAGPSD